MNTNTLARSGVLFARVVQYALAAFAAVVVLGSLNMGGFQAIMLGVFSLTLLAFVGVLELIAVRPVQRRWSA